MMMGRDWIFYCSLTSVMLFYISAKWKGDRECTFAFLLHLLIVMADILNPDDSYTMHILTFYFHVYLFHM